MFFLVAYSEELNLRYGIKLDLSIIWCFVLLPIICWRKSLSVAERIFHMVLYELLLLGLTVVIVVFFTEHDATIITGVAIVLSLIAMAWNFIYNWLFDKVLTGKKTERSMSIRAIHAIVFEVGLMIFSLPLIAWSLQISLWDALILDIGLTILVVMYTFIFNLVYDHTREKLVNG